jgi:hypothetical protein
MGKTEFALEVASAWLCQTPPGDALELLMRWMTDAARVHAGLKPRGVAEHPLNPKLFYESIFDRLRRALA